MQAITLPIVIVFCIVHTHIFQYRIRYK